MAKQDIILRSLVNAYLSAKGAELTWDELDQNFVEVFSALQELSASPGVDDYDNATEYNNGLNAYAMYDGQLYRWINPTPGTDVTPGTDPTKWISVYATILTHPKNKDQYLDQGGANEVTAAGLKPLETAYAAGGRTIYTAKVVLTAAQIKAGATTPIEIVAGVNNYYLDPVDAFVDWNFSVGLDVGDLLKLKINGMSNHILELGGLSGLATRKILKMGIVPGIGSAAGQMVWSKGIDAEMDADSTTGTGTATVYINFMVRAI